MIISDYIQGAIRNSSVIRKMFEEGNRLVKIHGADKVFDLSIGNPVFEPPPELNQALGKLLVSDEPGTHRYMPNPGYPQTREFVAGSLRGETGLSFRAEDVIMSVGAAGALNVLFRTLLNPGDEVIVLLPYFGEYDFYVANHGGSVRHVESDPAFHIDIDALRQGLTPGVKAVLINSPNNPTGVVYTKTELDQVGQLLTEKSSEFGYPITLVSDEPYRRISFEGIVPSIFKSYKNSVVATSYSKDLAIPGERIGYLAISPEHAIREELQNGAVVATRILGYVNAPAIWQRVIPLVGEAQVDIGPYRENCDILYDHLVGCGFECTKPGGGFFLFPKTPGGDDDAFVQSAKELNLLVVPGWAFRRSGHFRISFCFKTEFIRRTLPLFRKLAEQYKLV